MSLLCHFPFAAGEFGTGRLHHKDFLNSNARFVVQASRLHVAGERV